MGAQVDTPAPTMRLPRRASPVPVSAGAPVSCARTVTLYGEVVDSVPNWLLVNIEVTALPAM